jgi:hypothetical protein
MRHYWAGMRVARYENRIYRQKEILSSCEAGSLHAGLGTSWVERKKHGQVGQKGMLCTNLYL